MTSSLLVIFGAGGHGRVVADAALATGGWQRIVGTDRDPAKCGGELLPGVPMMPVADCEALAPSVHIAIGNAKFRQKEAHALRAHPLVTLTHPHATIAATAVVGDGSFVAAQAVVAPYARLGSCAIVNHGAVVDHDVEVGEFTHIAPQVALGGGARIGARCLVGSGVRVLPGVHVCDDVVLGAGTVVIAPIREPGVYVGVPARRVK